MNKVVKAIIAAGAISLFFIAPVFAQSYNNYSPASAYTFPTAPSTSYHDAVNSSIPYNKAPYGAPQLTNTPDSIGNLYYSPETTNYTQVSYDAYIGTIPMSSSQNKDFLSSIKNFKLSNLGINRTIAEVLGALTPNYDGANSSCAWYSDPNNANGVICTCGNYKIYFDCYASSNGMDIYATISSNAGIYTFTQSEIINFFKNLDVQLTNIENEKKENETNNPSYGTYYNNSVIINGTNSGTIIING
ncbi:hypothetical protein AB2T96_00375 [Clostridium butyricum]|uniref:hypothetical protein n=1 Tax=Clostridium butyricum TaxID=1492 RepID=UPI003466C433